MLRTETKVGLFLLASFGLLMAATLFMGKIHIFSHSQTFYLEFENVEALPPKAAVKIAGVEIGLVKKVSLKNGRAVVTIGVDSSIPVYQDAQVRIGSTGIIGTRFVELIPGTEGAGILPSGSTIKGKMSASLEQMIAKVSALFDDDPVHGNSVDNLKASLAHIRNVTAALDHAMGQREHDLQDIVTNIRELTQSAKVFAQHLEEISTEKKDDVKVAIEKFKSIGIKLDEIMTKINSGEGTIGALVSDKKTAEEVKETIGSLKDTAASAKKVMGRFTMINTYWNYRYRYDTRDSEGRSDVGVTFVPRPGKFYSIGGTNLGEAPEDEKHTKYERKNRITAVMGSDYGPFTGFVGAIRSRGGFGLNFRPFWFNKKLNRRVELTSEYSDFSRDIVINGKRFSKTFVSAGAHVAVNKWWWLGVRGEDLLERGAFMAYTNIVFRDEDLSYLLGFASIAR